MTLVGITAHEGFPSVNILGLFGIKPKLPDEDVVGGVRGDVELALIPELPALIMVVDDVSAAIMPAVRIFVNTPFVLPAPCRGSPPLVETAVDGADDDAAMAGAVDETFKSGITASINDNGSPDFSSPS